MKLLKAQQQTPNKIILEIDKIHYIKSMTPLPELLNGEALQNPIEVRKYSVSETPRKGVGGKTYAEKNIQFLEAVKEYRQPLEWVTPILKSYIR